jgi:hypothetical protein
MDIEIKNSVDKGHRNNRQKDPVGVPFVFINFLVVLERECKITCFSSLTYLFA